MSEESRLTIEVVCPCGQARLTVDPELGAVLHHESPPKAETVTDLKTAVEELRGEAGRRHPPLVYPGRGPVDQVQSPLPGPRRLDSYLRRELRAVRIGKPMEPVDALSPEVARLFAAQEQRRRRPGYPAVSGEGAGGGTPPANGGAHSSRAWPASTRMGD